MKALFRHYFHENKHPKVCLQQGSYLLHLYLCNNSEKVLQVIYLSIQVQILGERCLYNCKLFSSKCAPGDSKQNEHKEFNESPKQTKDLISNSLSGLRLLEEKVLCMLYPSVLGLLCTKKTYDEYKRICICLKVIIGYKSEVERYSWTVSCQHPPEEEFQHTELPHTIWPIVTVCS